MPENQIGVCDYRNRGGAFVPFKGQSSPSGVLRTSRKEDKEVSLSRVPSLSLMPPTPMSELGGTGDSNQKSSHSCRAGSGSSFLTEQVKLASKPQQVQTQQQQQQPFRKQRRCWSIDLHRRFVDAIQQLGGSQGKIFMVVCTWMKEQVELGMSVWSLVISNWKKLIWELEEICINWRVFLQNTLNF